MSTIQDCIDNYVETGDATYDATIDGRQIIMHVGFNSEDTTFTDDCGNVLDNLDEFEEYTGWARY